jgi:hypothetical protein
MAALLSWMLRIAACSVNINSPCTGLHNNQQYQVIDFLVNSD